MRNVTAGAAGGLVAGLILSGVMAFGRDAGLLHQTLAERAEDWLDDNFGVRGWAGDGGAEVLERTNHLAASAIFGAVYGLFRPATRIVSPTMAGLLFGTGLYAVAIGKVAPRIGLTEGEDAVETGVAMQRLGMHVLFGILTAFVTDALAPPKTARVRVETTRVPVRPAGAA